MATLKDHTQNEQERYQEAEAYYQQFLLMLNELGLEQDDALRKPDERTSDVRTYLQTKRIQRKRALQSAIPISRDDSVSPSSCPHHTKNAQEVLSYSPTFYNAANSLLALPAVYTQPRVSLEASIADCSMRFGLMLAHMIALIEKWYGMAKFCHELQHQLDQHIKALEDLKALHPGETFTLSRRSLLITLATLPTTMLISNKQVDKLTLNVEEFLPQCAASITSCWYLSGGNNLDTIISIIDTYLPTLIMVMKHVPSYSEVAADLLAQCYFLKTILAWHVEGLDTAEMHCLQALHYSDISKNVTLRLTALNQHALILYYGKHFQKALAKSEEAYSLLQHTTHEHILPIVQGRVTMYLAAIQAQQGRAQAEHTLEQAHQAFALQTTHADPVPLYADCGNAPLALWDGLAHYHLSQHGLGSAEQALTSLRTFGLLQPTLNIPERFRLECLNSRTLAAIQCNDIEEAITCFEAGFQGAKLLDSKQRNSEVTFAYCTMQMQWPQEQRIRQLKSHEP